ncbi:MAG: transglutaminase domain-containing protein, partial [Bacteroidota bacterium]
GIPLNAVEFQQAIIEQADFKLIDANGEVDEGRRKKYLNFIPHYLYFFDFKFDQREMPYDSLYKVNDKGLLMLVPLNVQKPTVFQRKYDMDYLEYTNSLGDFYQKPE